MRDRYRSQSFLTAMHVRQDDFNIRQQELLANVARMHNLKVDQVLQYLNNDIISLFKAFEGIQWTLTYRVGFVDRAMRTEFPLHQEFAITVEEQRIRHDEAREFDMDGDTDIHMGINFDDTIFSILRLKMVQIDSPPEDYDFDILKHLNTKGNIKQGSFVYYDGIRYKVVDITQTSMTLHRIAEPLVAPITIPHQEFEKVTTHRNALVWDGHLRVVDDTHFTAPIVLKTVLPLLIKLTCDSDYPRRLGFPQLHHSVEIETREERFVKNVRMDDFDIPNIYPIEFERVTYTVKELSLLEVLTKALLEAKI